jgi:hypothetical protein
MLDEKSKSFVNFLSSSRGAFSKVTTVFSRKSLCSIPVNPRSAISGHDIHVGPEAKYHERNWNSPFAPASPTQAPDTIKEFLPRLLGVHVVSKHDTLIVAHIARAV